jgi:hypothetical protein
MIVQQVGCNSPCEGWVALNTDGAKEAGSNYGNLAKIRIKEMNKHQEIDFSTIVVFPPSIFP